MTFKLPHFPVPDFSQNGRFKWTILAFILAIIFVGGVLIWQLFETKPERWCQIAESAAPENINACLAVLVKLIDVKDHVLIGVTGTLALTVLSLAVVALGVRLSGSGPGGTSVNISEKDTTISTPDASVTVPTPPSEETR